MENKIIKTENLSEKDYIDIELVFKDVLTWLEKNKSKIQNDSTKFLFRKDHKTSKLNIRIYIEEHNEGSSD